MKVLLLKDVYKLGRAGDVKRVAAGYGRNYLLPQGLAVLATPGALKQVERIRKQAEVNRAVMNKEMSGVADILSDLVLTFPAKAGETGKLYGSITSQMIADAIEEQTNIEINRRQLDSEPIRMLGEHKVSVRLTIDLIPEITVVVHREGEAVALPGEETAEEGEAEAIAEETAEEGEAEAIAEEFVAEAGSEETPAVEEPEPEEPVETE
jgi:large subunit ribosomal protein L9